jgi:hypothetical protein
MGETGVKGEHTLNEVTIGKELCEMPERRLLTAHPSLFVLHQ